MKPFRFFVYLAVASLGCSRADVYPITHESQAGSGGLDAGAEAKCPASIVQAGDTSRTVVVAGVSRRYILHIPAAYDATTPAPLVIDFHGIGDSADDQRASSPYPRLLDGEGVVMAFPEGATGPAGSAWNVGPCCVDTVDDVAFARALVAEVRRLACIDPQRVYAVGVLTGGGMAHYLACHAADVFSAVAPAAFDLLEENVGECQPSRAISVVSFRGTADTRVPYAGGPSSVVPGMPLTFLGAQATFRKWAELNRCAATASSEDARGCAHFSGCQGNAEVILCTKQGGHEEHGDPSIAWPVLERHTL
ncbi:MAG: alpha/beta hydrolase family esterase [Myxococcota bacterium]